MKNILDVLRKIEDKNFTYTLNYDGECYECKIGTKHFWLASSTGNNIIEAADNAFELAKQTDEELMKKVDKFENDEG